MFGSEEHISIYNLVNRNIAQPAKFEDCTIDQKARSLNSYPSMPSDSKEKERKKTGYNLSYA